MFTESECILCPFGSFRTGMQYLDVAEFADPTIRAEPLSRRPTGSFPFPFDLPFLLPPAAVA